MIYICYGMTKSSSTFLYQLTEEIFRVAGRDPVLLGPPFRSRIHPDNYFDLIDGQLLDRIAERIGDASAVLKTHSPPRPEIAERVASGEILANVSYRDPREIALSLVDHGTRSRRVGMQPFAQFHSPTDAIPSLDVQVENCRRWADLPGVEAFSYNEICFDTQAIIRRICAQLDVEVDVRRVLEPFRSRSRIGEYSKGVPLRYREEMPEAEQRQFLERYAGFYERFGPETPAATALADRLGNAKKRPSGILSQLLIFLRRRFRV